MLTRNALSVFYAHQGFVGFPRTRTGIGRYDENFVANWEWRILDRSLRVKGM